MNILGKLKLLLQFKRVADAIEKEKRNGMDFKITFKKALKEFAKSGGSVAAVAVLGWLSDNSVVTGILQHSGVSVALIAVLVPLIHSGVEALENVVKHAGDEPKALEPPVG